MPVPVTRFSKPVAHPVNKDSYNCSNGQFNTIRNLTSTLPISPVGPPPSFGTRDEWINSLPTWRRTKPRRIWEDDVLSVDQLSQQRFTQGLVDADNASIIKGAHAEACLPPLCDMFAIPSPDHGDADDEMSSDYANLSQHDNTNGVTWEIPSSPVNLGDHESYSFATDMQCSPQQPYERGAFTPVFEDQSPDTASGPEPASSPPEPLTPFGDFVDRAVAAAQDYIAVNSEDPNPIDIPIYECCDTGDRISFSQAPIVYPSIAEEPKGPPSLESSGTNAGYKKLAEPLSAWVANYVWKVCTTGLSLPFMFSQPSTNCQHYSNATPAFLAPAVHSLLLSTLLQPSGIFLALWYIVRLPVYFNAAPLSPERVKELRFRAALLGDGISAFETEGLEGSSSFRLIVLGCMLANKWLDDHTFSNKTWYTISNIPVAALNNLEALALDIFSYDLSVSNRDWSQWLTHVRSYHLSLSSPLHVQPISRPSTNPHSIVRKAIEEIIQAPVACTTSSGIPQPVFLGLEERKREILEREQAMDNGVLEIDLDEDGPLREEYLPRRHISGTGSLHGPRSRIGDSYITTTVINSFAKNSQVDTTKVLPPPAKWSPAGDEPILRERNRVNGHYVAVQAPPPPPILFPVAYQQPCDVRYKQNWNPAGSYLPIKQQSLFMFDLPPMQHTAQPTHHAYPYLSLLGLSHTRSQSHAFDQDLLPRQHTRSYSQNKFEYRCSDLRVTANELAPALENNRWMEPNIYPYTVPVLAPTSGLGFQPSTWLRA